mmetsp:Transcript_27279/g.64078  ORF Transcript_27279/g.64078 Transcript_27279/m.64078 type:complete len:233 (+) Transcript_27279:117-815(+)
MKAYHQPASCLRQQSSSSVSSNIALQSYPLHQSNRTVFFATAFKLWPRKNCLLRHRAEPSLLLERRPVHVATTMLPENVQSSLHPRWGLLFFKLIGFFAFLRQLILVLLLFLLHFILSSILFVLLVLLVLVLLSGKPFDFCFCLRLPILFAGEGARSMSWGFGCCLPLFPPPHGVPASYGVHLLVSHEGSPTPCAVELVIGFIHPVMPALAPAPALHAHRLLDHRKSQALWG